MYERGANNVKRGNKEKAPLGRKCIKDLCSKESGKDQSKASNGREEPARSKLH